eukprot:CAMPEP_0182441800 /NCGR_PEP_ID=MMETSP1172-20130603/796_1 /TAXON_ID=708627 /ORGANISM="Timspurckia oligopyrenoides, Strain CCMP3278" /LENGTH=531 /DNA_ID=CAMNT_0024636339 /DNA_START=230 /DNA_END=1825 /DNA_ORIENTATION=-
MSAAELSEDEKKWYEKTAQNAINEYLSRVEEARGSAKAASLQVTPPSAKKTVEPVKIEYETPDDGLLEEEFDVVLIACQPEQLEGAMKFTQSEEASFQLLRNSWFFTTLVKAKKPHSQNEEDLSEWGNWDVALTGNIQGRREEYNARNPGSYIPANVEDTYYTVYQQEENPVPPETVQQLQTRLESIRDASINDQNNNFFLRDPEYIGEPWMSTYFPHFGSQDIEHIWSMYNIQGQNNTFYVSSAMCFESVLHVYEYGCRLFDQKFKSMYPKDQKIAIIGAGPAGLLWASMFLKEYGNVTVLEKSERFGGKTRTEHHLLSDGTDVVCELGTCYLSPAYEHMMLDFQAAGFFNRRDEIGLGKYNFFQGHKEWRKVVSNGRANAFNGSLNYVQAVQDLTKYIKLHQTIMGVNRPIPSTWRQISAHQADLQLSFKKFLEKHGFKSLITSLLYAYQHQGYGRLDEIPALYGLIWVTPEVFHGIVGNTLVGQPSMVRCLKEGWHPIWEEAVRSCTNAKRVRIVYNAHVTKITRPGV